MGFPGAFTWLQQRQRNAVITPGCKTVPFTTTSLLGTLNGALGKSLWECYVATLGVPISG